jgi:hypothetical protein
MTFERNKDEHTVKGIMPINGQNHKVVIFTSTFMCLYKLLCRQKNNLPLQAHLPTLEFKNVFAPTLRAFHGKQTLSY